MRRWHIVTAQRVQANMIETWFEIDRIRRSDPHRRLITCLSPQSQ